MAKSRKSRYWAFVVYPESAPDDWQKRLQLTGLRIAISPCHDQDIDPDDGAKKPHWHVIACWDGPTTCNAAKTLTDELCAPIPQALNSVRGYYRYLTHADNPDKHQYDPADIQHLGGFDPADYIEWTRSELERLKDDVDDYIEEHNILEYRDLLVSLKAAGLQDLRRVARNNTIHCRAYIASRRHKAGMGDVRIDPTTGELIE